MGEITESYIIIHEVIIAITEVKSIKMWLGFIIICQKALDGKRNEFVVRFQVRKWLT